MKKDIAIALLPLLLSCSASRRLSIVTYNVGAFNKSHYSSIEEIASMMKEVKADVISLNEVDSCTVRTGKVDQIKEFASELGGWDYTYAKAIDHQGGGYGIGIVSAPGYKPVVSGHFILDKGEGKEYRACAVNEYENFILLTTHLENKVPAVRLQQIKAVCQWVEDHYKDADKPIFLCGDMNSAPDSAVLSYLKKNWTVLSPADYTMPSWEPRKCIDYILVYNNAAAATVKVKVARVIKKFKTGNVAKTSDHLPVLVKVSIPKK